MSPPVAAAALLALTLALAGCGGGKEDEPVDPCPRADAPARALAGALVRQPVGTGLFEVLPVEGKAKRSGRVGKLGFGDYTFRARGEAEGGGLNGRRGSRAAPVPGFDGIGFLDAFAVSYRKDGQAMAGMAAVGKPTPGKLLATTGQARYRGPVRLELQDRRLGAPGVATALVGTASAEVRFGSRQVTVSFEGLTPEEGAAPVARVDWTGLGMCGVRIGSTGQGGFRALDGDGRVTNFAGPSADSPNGSAVIDAGFYGFDAATAQPAGLGGVLLIQGDAGAIAGIFAAARTD